MKKNILFLALMIFFTKVYAGAYVLPVSYVGTRVVQKIVAWDEPDNAKNPCYGWSSCYLGPDVKYPSIGPGLYGSCIESGNCIRIEKYETTKQVADAWKNAKGIPWVSNEYTVTNTEGTCVGVFYIQSPSIVDTDASSLFPGSVCGKLPPPNVSCNIAMPESIDFGVITNENNQNFTKSITGSLSCSASTPIKVFAQSTTGEKDLYLNSGKTLVASVLLNNSNAFTGISMTGTPATTSLTLQSTLSVKGQVSAGDYSGSILVYIAYI
ncbi:hypothetical protein [Rahnella laticis]|uniref:MrpH family fimbial adhesin n=1 Tax=Rahnella laticis TaxID=2787622 RepID=UPI0018A28C01|nr:hypothetical protein [Rahnella laticis]MBF7997768.1 hypothetical protein [Rahnella laticis]